MTGYVARLLVARAAVLDAARAVRSEAGCGDHGRILELADRLDRIADELREIEEALVWGQGR